VMAACPPFAPRTVALSDALGCVLAADVVSPESVPPFDNTAVDGYAVRAADTEGAPVELEAIGVLAAGFAAERAVESGQALRIMTGAPLPDGADAVVMVEDTEATGDRVRVARTVAAGDAVRRAGDDVRAGEVVLAAGTVLRPAHLGVLSSIGVLDVAVVPKATVGVLSTGDELVEGGAPLRPGQIRESNRPMLLALVAEAGAEAVDLGLVRDDEAELAAVIERAAAECDALVTSGGVSMGDYDVVKDALGRLGTVEFVQVAMQPGKPQGFGLIGSDRIPMIMLPGNPVSAFVSFEAFARPVIRKLMGVTPYTRPPVKARATHAMSSTSARRQLARGIITHDDDGNRLVSLAGGHGSHLVGDLSRANALVMLPEETDLVATGEQVEVWLLSEGL
jgi:molybdopterin molybdotransferase